MASSRRTGTSEDVSTYDSGGGKDYSSLATWEQATDINCVTGTTSPVLEVYAGAHDDNDELDGATTSSTYFRIVRPADGEGHSGIPKVDGSVAAFVQSDSGNDVLRIGENYTWFQDLVVKATSNATNSEYNCITETGTGNGFCGTLCVDSTNSGTGMHHGFLVYNGCIYVNNLSINMETRGFIFIATTSAFVYNCTASENDVGFWNNTSGQELINCLSSGNSSVDIDTNFTQTTCLDGGSPSFVDTSGDDYHLASDDTAAKDNGTDLSGDSDFAFDDDIDGETRSDWDIGFDEYIVSGIPAQSVDGVLTAPTGAYSRGLKAGRSYGGTL